MNQSATELYPAFTPLPDYDVVLSKVRYYAGTGNELELILSSQKIETVILVSCVLTASMLMDADVAGSLALELLALFSVQCIDCSTSTITYM